MKETFDYRWGIPAMDDDFIRVPGSLLRNFHKVGLTPLHLVLILCLITRRPATYDEVKERLGIPFSVVADILASLIMRGLANDHELYMDFAPLVAKCQELDSEV